MTSNDLEPVHGEIVRTAPLMPMALDDAARAMTAYQDLTRSVLDAADWIGRPGEPESFVKRSGWQKLATFYGVSTELFEQSLERVDGELTRASARVRAIARDGRYADGGGACGRNEPRFRSSSGRQKIEHDLPATAETRATNRAISNLIGFGAVSAEEVDADVRAGKSSETPNDLPDWAAAIDDDAGERFANRLEAILGAAGVLEPAAAAFGVGRSTAAFCDGVIPAAVARLVALLEQATVPQTGPPVPPLETEQAAAAPDVPPQEG